MAAALEQLLTDAASRDAQTDEFRRMHETLRQNTAEKAADVILGMLGRRGA
jgi:lipid A disaccharide synthetase